MRRIYSLLGKYVVGTTAKVYGFTLSNKLKLQHALIPEQIASILGSTGMDSLFAATAFIPTFSTFIDNSSIAPELERKLKSIATNPGFSVGVKTKKITRIINEYMTHVRDSAGIQSWIDLLNFLCPIPFVGISKPDYKAHFQSKLRSGVYD
jgi:hypothetical protein